MKKKKTIKQIRKLEMKLYELTRPGFKIKNK